jgi:NAD(P)-dependent dehydrogenase (short-subunit alcohol dehydrogenase family)
MSKVALITGGSSGIGKAIAEDFLNSGLNVAILARNKEKLDTVVNEFKNKKGKIIGISADVTDTKAIKNSLETIYNEFGQLDILVNSAGGGPVGGIMDISDEEWKNSISIKQMGYVKVTRESIPYLKKAKSGHIINIIGVFGKQPHPNFIIGSVTNAALIAFTKAVSLDVAQYNIKVNAINPGACNTPLWSDTLNEMATKFGGNAIAINDDIKKMSAFNRIAEPNDIAKVASFLVSDNANFITGISINVDGGVYSGV